MTIVSQPRVPRQHVCLNRGSGAQRCRIPVQIAGTLRPTQPGGQRERAAGQPAVKGCLAGLVVDVAVVDLLDPGGEQPVRQGAGVFVELRPCWRSTRGAVTR